MASFNCTGCRILSYHWASRCPHKLSLGLAVVLIFLWFMSSQRTRQNVERHYAVCSHRGLTDATLPVPRSVEEWEKVVQELLNTQIPCTDVDIIPVGDVFLIGHPSDVAKDSAIERSSRATFTSFLALMVRYPSLHVSMELKPRSTGGAIDLKSLDQLVDEAEAGGVTARLAFQLPLDIVAGASSSDRWIRPGILLSVPLRNHDGAECGINQPGDLARAVPRADVIMPAVQCVGSSRVRRAVQLWREAKELAAEASAVQVWIVDSCEAVHSLMRMQRQVQGEGNGKGMTARAKQALMTLDGQINDPILIDRMISNVPAAIRDCNV